MNGTVFEELVSITEDYLGPTARRFMARQISSHLGIEPELVSRDDVQELAQWARATISLLTSDRAMIDEYIHKLLRLANVDHDHLSGTFQNN